MTTLTTSTLRPGLLVSLSTSLHGNVKYDRTDLENDLVDNRAHAKWETTKEIADVAEYEAGTKARSKASTIIRSVCVQSKFGLLCPEAQAWRLAEACAEARTVVDAFNAVATLTRLEVNVMTGRIASDDAEAVKKINSEMRELIDRMETGVSNMDASAIREAANRAKSVGNMLTPEAQVRIQFAIDAARSVARTIVKAGEGAALEVDKLAVQSIREQRTAFLDLDDQPEIVTPQAQARTVDMGEYEATQTLGRGYTKESDNAV